MFDQASKILTSRARTVFAVALFSLLLLAACGSPAQEMPASADSAEQETMEESAAESESMAETDDDMADDKDESTDESEAMADHDEESMDEDSEHMDDSAMSETEAMTDTAKMDSEMADGEMADEAEAEEAMVDETMADEAMAAVDLPAWQQLALTDARTGEPFTFADLSGKTVFVEPMATWCGNCRRQLTNVQEASGLLGDDVVFVALSVETNIADEELAAYADDAGFDYTFAVMTPEMLTELAGAFGQTISNPPATPHFIILPDGSTTDLVTGIEPAADLVAQLEATRG